MPTTKTPEELRQKLVDDPNTVKLAEALKMPYEDFIKLVLHYAVSGDKPQFFVVKDEDLRKFGHEPPDREKMQKYVADAISVAVAHSGTAFQGDQKKPVTLAADGLKQPDLKTDAELKAQLDAELRGKRGGKT